MKRPTGQPAQLNSPLPPSGGHEAVGSPHDGRVWVDSVSAQADPWGSESDLWQRLESEAELPALELEELTPSLVPIRFAHSRLSDIPQLDDVSLVTSSVTTGAHVGRQQGWAGDERGGAEVFQRIRHQLSLPPSAQPSTLKPQGVFEVSAPPEGQWLGDEEAERSLSRMKSTRPAQVIASRPAAPSTRPARPTLARSPDLSLKPSAVLSPEQVQLERARSDAKRSSIERLELEQREMERLEQELLEAERLEQELLEAERLEQELLEAERLEQELLEAERLEAERLEQELLEAERLEAERKQRETDEVEAELLSMMSAEEVITFTFGLNHDALSAPHRELQSLPPVSQRLIEAITPDAGHVAQVEEVTELGEDDETLPPVAGRPEPSQRDERADLFHTERKLPERLSDSPPTLRLRPLRKGGLTTCQGRGSHSEVPRELPMMRAEELYKLLNLRPLRPLYEPRPLEGGYMPRRHVASLYKQSDER